MFCFKKCVEINNVFKLNLIAASVIFTIGCSPQDAAAEPKPDIFKSETFLTWDRDAQEFYIRTSVGMAGLIAARNDKAHGKCLEDWYFTDESAANSSIIAVMKDYPEYHPRGVIVAVMEKRCGSIIYAER
ncbi:MAG: hypothetical protein DHS20C05_06760 [Hyphococcus sp.]|nr:MAG: hypothetical protein DHS20C05_06760 [Marinicaulis sp.]